MSREKLLAKKKMQYKILKQDIKVLRLLAHIYPRPNKYTYRQKKNKIKIIYEYIEFILSLYIL